MCGSPLKATARRTDARSSSNYRNISNWRRHILQRLGAAPVELREGKVFVIGRSSESDMKVASPKISRKHTEIFWRADVPVVRDLGSENGTQVNDKPVKEHALEDRDEITIGPFSCTYRCLQGRTSIQVSQELMDSQADTQAMLAVAMTGDLTEMGVYELLETLSYNQKTGTLEVYSPAGNEGSVAIQEGLPLHAQCGSLEGEAAVYHLLNWGEGQYRFVAGIDPDLQPNLWLSIQQILTRAQDKARSTDKHKKLPPGSPPPQVKRRPGNKPGQGPNRPTGKRRRPPPA